MKWPLILLVSGLLIFRLGVFFRPHQPILAVACIVLGYALIFASIVWTIMKITFLKNPEDDTD
jgi:hypothetical protein